MQRSRLGAGLALVSLAWLSACASGPDTGPSTRTEAPAAGGAADAASLLRSGRAEEAKRVLLARSWRSPDDEIVLGEACLQLGDSERAASAFYAARAAPDAETLVEFKALAGLGELALRRHDAFVALARFQEAESIAPGMYERDQALIGQARAEVQAGHRDAARALRRQVLRRDVPGIVDLDVALSQAAPERPKPPATGPDRPPAATGGALARRPKGKGIPPPKVRDRSDWGADPIRRSGNPEPMGSIDRLTIHHTADLKPDPAASFQANAGRVKAIQNAHQDAEHWADIGYHFILGTDGSIIEGRELIYQGAHAGNPEANQHNVGIALIGNCEKQQPKPAQKKALFDLVKWLCAEYSIPASRVYGHDEIKKKHMVNRGTACPGKNLEALFPELRRAIGGATSAPAKNAAAAPSAPAVKKGKPKGR